MLELLAELVPGMYQYRAYLLLLVTLFVQRSSWEARSICKSKLCTDRRRQRSPGSVHGSLMKERLKTGP